MQPIRVFPACAGVIRLSLDFADAGASFPRMCGGDPPVGADTL